MVSASVAEFGGTFARHAQFDQFGQSVDRVGLDVEQVGQHLLAFRRRRVVPVGAGDVVEPPSVDRPRRAASAVFGRPSQPSTAPSCAMNGGTSFSHAGPRSVSRRQIEDRFHVRTCCRPVTERPCPGQHLLGPGQRFRRAARLRPTACATGAARSASPGRRPGNGGPSYAARYVTDPPGGAGLVGGQQPQDRHVDAVPLRGPASTTGAMSFHHDESVGGQRRQGAQRPAAGIDQGQRGHAGREFGNRTRRRTLSRRGHPGA